MSHESPPSYSHHLPPRPTKSLAPAQARRPTAEDYLDRGSPAPADGRPARRTSPRLNNTAEPSLPPPSSAVRCPLCPNNDAEPFGHMRKAHPGHPFLPSDFPNGSVSVCAQCGAVMKPDRKAMTVHLKACKGDSVRMARRRAGHTVTDKRGRSISASSTPLRAYASAPAMPPPTPPSAHPQSRPSTPTAAPSQALIASPPPQPATSPLRQRPAPATTPQPPLTPLPTHTQLATPMTVPQPPPATAQRTMADLLPPAGSVKHIHPGLVRPFVACASRLAEAYNNEPTSENLFNILALVKVGLVPDMRNGQAAVKHRLADYPRVPWPQPGEKVGGTKSGTVRAREMVEAGLVGKAERALSGEAKVAPLDDNVLAALRDKHPAGTDNPFQAPLRPTPLPTMPEEVDIGRALRSFRPDTSPGPSGWSVKLTTLAIADPHFATFLTSMTAQMAAGIAAGQPLLCASRLTPLIKADGGIRPIAVGELFYRLAMKAIFATNFDPTTLSPRQFGVGTKGGVEPISRALQYALDGHPAFPYRYATALDAKNAFNTLFRRATATALFKHCPSFLRLASWSYNTPTPLLLSDGRGSYQLWSEEGVRQGDPMGPYFFSITIKDVVEELQRFLGPRYLVLAYLDDIFILGPDDKGLGLALDFFAREGSLLTLNPDKCKQYSLDDVAADGMELLGTCIGSRGFRERFLNKKIDALTAGLEKIHTLPRQHALLILRLSLQHKLRHLQRSLQSDDLPHLWQRLDDALHTTFDRIRGVPVPGGVIDRDRTIITLPPSLGGVGLASFRECAPLAYQASTSLAIRTLQLLVPALDDPIPTASQSELCKEVFTQKQHELLTSLHIRDRVSVIESSSQLGRKWLTAIPSSARFLLPDDAVQANLCYRTLITGYGGRCKKCAAPNTLGHDEWCTGRKDYRVSRHEAVKHRLAAGLRTIPDAEVVVEPFMETRTNRRNDIRLTIDSNNPDRPLAAEEYDLKVVSLYAPTHEASMRTNGKTRQEREAAATAEAEGRLKDDTEDRALRVLAQQARRKTTALPEGLNCPFTPLVLSTGGLQDRGTKEKLAEWKKWKMPGVAYSWMLMSVSVALARARGRTFLSAT